MLSNKPLQALRLAFIATIFVIAGQVQAATYNVYGNANLSTTLYSEYANPVGQSIVDALVGKYAAFSATVNTSVTDSDPSADVFLLNTAVSSTANIAGFNFVTTSYSCFSVQYDCKVESKVNFPTETYRFDNQLITSEMMSGNALATNSRLTFYYYTVGNDLFTTPQLIDPFSAGTLTAGFSIFYLYNNQSQRINFELSNITATPVPEPDSSAMFGAALLIGLLLNKKRTTA